MTQPMRVLVACEFSGTVREAFLTRGHDAWSCDLLPDERGSNRHIKGDVREILNDGWDLLMVAHPPCTPRVHLMPPSPGRWKERSRTYQGIAEAMAAQWGEPHFDDANPQLEMAV